MTKVAAPPEQPDFSLVLGGPLFHLLRRCGMAGDALQMARRRMLAVACVAWLPLLLLSALAGHAHGGGIAIDFLHDIEVHVRFLVVLPVLIAAELVVHQRLRPLVAEFVARGIVTPEDEPGFRRAIDATMRARNSVLAEVALLVGVYTIGLWVWRSQVAIDTTSWYALADGGRLRFTPAGYWYVLVSVPLFQFILVRWYLRLFLWFWFLWRVSRLNLRLLAGHPDRTGGLGFLGSTIYAFSPLLFAEGAMLAGVIASQIFYADHGLLEYREEIAVALGFLVLVMLGPLAMFSPHLVRAKREGLAAYGKLSSRYTAEFEQKWVRGGAPAGERLVGSADIQSLSDLATGYAVVQGMRFVPFGWRDVLWLVAIAGAPFLPLTLMIFSVEELVGYLFKILF